MRRHKHSVKSGIPKKYKNKRPGSINGEYLKEHWKEILEVNVPVHGITRTGLRISGNVDVGSSVGDLLEASQKRLIGDSEFGRHDTLEEIDNVDRNFCKKTGHWDLFNWDDVGDLEEFYKNNL